MDTKMALVIKDIEKRLTGGPTFRVLVHGLEN